MSIFFRQTEIDILQDQIDRLNKSLCTKFYLNIDQAGNVINDVLCVMAPALKQGDPEVVMLLPSNFKAACDRIRGMFDTCWYVRKLTQQGGVL